MKFAHLADCHLGYFQYGLVQRAKDIADAYLWACVKIAQEKCDFCILAGDLFHHRQVDPVSLGIACEGLRMMGCPVFMIKGNHEMMRSANETDWIDFLASEGLLTLVVKDDSNFIGVSYPRVKIYGLNWAGMATDQMVSQLNIPLKLHQSDFVILMLHAGMEDALAQNHPGTVSWEVLRPLMDRVNYVALGHVHKPLQTGWVMNPGSLETIASDEYQWHERGLLINNVAEDGSFTTQLYVPPRREFYFLNDLWFEIAEPEDFEQLNNAIVVLDSTQPEETTNIINKMCQPLYIKVNKLKRETSKVQVQTSSKLDMEIEAIKQLTEIEPQKVLEMKGLKDGETIWHTVE